MTHYSKTAHKRLGNLPDTKETKLRNGANGNKDTVSIMKRIAHQRSTHPIVRQLAMNIIHDAKIKSHSYLDECIAIGKYVQKHMRYLKDPRGTEQLTDPILLIEKLVKGEAMGDCDDMALLIVTLLKSIGHGSSLRFVKYKNLIGPYNHIYVVVYQQNFGNRRQRFVLDAIVKHKPLGFEVPHIYGTEVKI